MTALKRSHSITHSSIGQRQHLFSGIPSVSGELVDSETVFGLPGFTAAIRLVASQIAKVEKQILVYEDDGGEECDYNHPVYYLLNRKANEFITSFAAIQTFVNSMIWSGHGYIFVERTPGGFTPVALHNLDSRFVYEIEEWDEERLVGLFYAIPTRGGRPVIRPAADILHCRYLSMHTGLQGISLVENLKTNLGLSLSIQKYGSLYFRNSGHLKLLLKLPGWLTDEQEKQMRQQFEGANSGNLEDAFKLMTLYGGADLTSLPVNNEEAQWLGSREFTLTDVANAIGIPVSKIGGKGHTSYNSLEQDNLGILTDCYDLIFHNLENEFASKLLGSREWTNKRIHFDRDELLLQDPLTRVKVVAEKRNNELISWEEAREELRLPVNRDGTWARVSNVVDVPAEPPPQMPVETPPTEQATDEPVEAPADNETVTIMESPNISRAIADAAVKRIQRRLVRASKSDQFSVIEHYGVIRDSLPIIGENLIGELEAMRGEIDNVLPEQRTEILKQWKPNLWKL